VALAAWPGFRSRRRRGRIIRGPAPLAEPGRNLMDAGLKQRLIGAAVLVALAVIFLPMLVKGPAPDSGVADLSTRVPDAPQEGYRAVVLPLATPGEAPSGGVLPVPEPARGEGLPTVDTATASPDGDIVVEDAPLP